MEKKPLKQDYSSPRWSMEIPDCSMPMSMDTYSKCAYNCLYCFSYFQKSHVVEGYLDGQPRCVNPQKVIALFENAIKNNRQGVTKSELHSSHISRTGVSCSGAASRTSSTNGNAGMA